MKVSYYLNDNNNYQYYKKELLSIINQELDNYNYMHLVTVLKEL